MNFRILFSCCVIGIMIAACTASSPHIAAPELSSINIIDRNGFSETINTGERLNQYKNVDFLKNHPYQKVLRIYSRDQFGNIKAYITSYYPNGQPKQYLEILNNRANGAYLEWHQNGVKKLQVTVVGGVADIDEMAARSWLFDGCSYAWDDQGRLLAEINYCRGDLEGMSTYFHCNGNVWKTIPMCKGKQEGVSYIYLENGTLLQSTAYSAGLRNGESLRYWDDKAIASEECFSNGLLYSGRYYSRCGEFIADIEEGGGYRAVFGKEGISELQEYQNGVQDGEVKVFDERGVLASVYHVKEGLKNGEEIEYFDPFHVDDDLSPRLSIHWHEGKMQGTMKTWYSNGVMESQREMSNNKKNGVLTGWYEDGSVMMIEEYDHEKLIKGEYFSPSEKIPASVVSNGRGLATIYDSKGHFIRKINYYNGRPVVE